MDFQEHIKDMFSKVNKTMVVLHKVHKILPRSSLLVIHKSFIRPHLDYENIMDEIYNTVFYQKQCCIFLYNAIAFLKFLETNVVSTYSILFLFLFSITYNTRNTNSIPLFKLKHNFFYFLSSFFPFWLSNWTNRTSIFKI